MLFLKDNANKEPKNKVKVYVQKNNKIFIIKHEYIVMMQYQ